MSTNVVFNGTTYTIPAVADLTWGTQVSAYLIALATGSLQKTGGTFTLTAEANFGATYGLKSVYYKSAATNPASAGQVRLGNTETIKWRNAANNADLDLTVNASNLLAYNSVAIPTISSTDTLTNKTLTAPTLTSPSIAGTITTALTASKVITTNASSQLAASATTDTEIGYVSGVTSAIQTQLNTKAATATSLAQFAATTSAQLAGVISDETGSGALVFATSPALTSPSIAGTITTAITASRVVLTNASSQLTNSTTTDTELGYVSGVTSAIQTQLNTKAATATSLAQFAATTSLQLKGVISDETGSGSLVFADTPTLVTPNIGVATGTSLVTSGNMALGGASLSATYPLEVTAATQGTTARFGTTNSPLTLGYFSNEGHLTSGATLSSGGTWTARQGAGSGFASDINLNPSGAGGMTFNCATTLTSGNSFTYPVTPAMTISSAGAVTVPGSLIGPVRIGGTAVSSSLTLQSTSGVGSSDSILMKVGNNGATLAQTINTSGQTSFGTTAQTVGLINMWTAANAELCLYMFKNTQVQATIGFKSSTDTNLYVGTGSSTIGTYGLYQANTSTAWTAVSDERKKDIIEPISDGLNKVNSLRAVIGKYKTDAPEKRRSFLIAQDVQAVLPEAINVNESDDGTLGLAYTDVIPLLVAAIKELSAKIKILESK